MSYRKKILDYLREKQAINSDKISSLKGVKVVFHAPHFYSQVPLTPKCLFLSDNQWFKGQARQRIQYLQRLGIKPLFVFNGVTPPCLQEVLFDRYERLEFWNYANTPFKSPDNDADMPLFYEAFHDEFDHDFLDVCITDSKKEYLEFVVGPYLASTQMAYLYNEGVAQAVHGPLDLLLFPKLPVILSYNDTHVEWTTDEIVMQKLGLTREKFEELIVLWTYPLETLDRSKDLMQASETALSRVRSKPGWLKLKALYKYPVVLDSDCVCRTLEKGQKMPKETEEFMGLKLPPKCYFYLFLGLVHSKLLSILVSGKILEYSNFVKTDSLSAFNMSNKAGKYQILLHLLRASSMMKPYLDRVSKLAFIDRPGSSTEMPALPESAKERKFEANQAMIVLYWDIAHEKITEETNRQMIKENQIGALFCIRWYIAEIEKPYETRTALKKVEKLKEMKKARELLCHTIFMYLEHRNYISGDKALLILGNLYQGVPAEFQDEAMIFFELLTYAGFNGMEEKMPHEKKDQVFKELIAEVFSLVPMKLKKGAAEDWNEYQVTNEFSRFMPIARSAWTSGREFVEGLLFCLFCNTDDASALEMEEYEKAYELLPFGTKPNYLLGVVILYLLEETGKGDHPLAGPSKWFTLAEDLVSDIKRGYVFWGLVLGMITNIYAHKAIDQNRYERFVEANKFLESKLDAMGIRDMIKSKQHRVLS